MAFGRRRRDLVGAAVADAERRLLDHVAAEQADLLRDGAVTERQALAAIAARFPRLTAGELRTALARGLFLSR